MAGHKLGIAEGTAMYVGAVLGPGVMSLPALGAEAAGPASILAWAVLLAISVPVALSFAALGGRYPGGGGISAFVERAFGDTAGVIVGWWFYAAVPVGVLAGALVGGHYVQASLALPPESRYIISAALLFIAFAANYVGLQVSGRLQLLLVGILGGLLVVTVTVAAPHVMTHNFVPVFPNGVSAIGKAALIVFYAFTGWEAAVHLSAEFRDPQRHLVLATKLTLGTVAVLYLSLAIVTVGVLGPAAGRSAVPMMQLLGAGLGHAAQPVTTVAAVMLSLGALNTFIAGAARLGAALGRSGALPPLLAKNGAAGQVPRISLTVQALITFALTALAAWFSLDLQYLMSLTSVFLGCVTLAGLIAAARLLTGRPILRGAVIASIIANIIVLAFGTLMLAFPLALAIIAFIRRRRRNNARESKAAENIDDLPPLGFPADEYRTDDTAGSIPQTPSVS